MHLFSLQTAWNPARPFYRTATALDTFCPKLCKCLFPGLASPILSAADLMNYCPFSAEKPRQHLVFEIPLPSHGVAPPAPPTPKPPGFQLTLPKTCSAWHALPLKCYIYEASPSNPVRTNPSFTHMFVSLCLAHLEFYSFLHPHVSICLCLARLEFYSFFVPT